MFYFFYKIDINLVSLLYGEGSPCVYVLFWFTFALQGFATEGAELDYERLGDVCKDLVSLLSSKSSHFQEVISSKEFQLYEERKVEIQNYDEEFEEEEVGEKAIMEKKEAKEQKQEKTTKKQVKIEQNRSWKLYF